MVLTDLKHKIDEIIESVKEDGNNPDEIIVSVQIDDMDGQSTWSTDIGIHYDNDCQVSGCCILGEKEVE